METFSKTYEVRWADMDPNRHMRHSVYNDYAAHTRVALFTTYGLPLDDIACIGLGPILFREETRFQKEVAMSDKLTVNCSLHAMHEDGSRWTFLHEMYRSDGTKAAILTVDGAWINLETRKLGVLPPEMLNVVYRFPRTDDFSWLE